MAERDLQRLRSLTRVLDEAIRLPGTRFRFGLDAILGILPGAGDAIGGVVSAYALIVAARAGATPSILLRMLLNILVDTVVGAVPLIGDLFDFGWKSNRRNLDLLERYIGAPHQTRTRSRAVLAAVLIALVILLVAAGLLALFVVRWIVREV